MTQQDTLRRSLLSRPLDDRLQVSRIEMHELTIPPGGTTPRHTHPGPVVSVVTQGAICMAIEGEATRISGVGEAIFEPGGRTIARFDNASATKPATFVATYLLDGEAPLISFLD